MRAPAFPTRNPIFFLLISFVVLGLMAQGCHRKSGDTSNDSKATPRELGLEYILKNQLDEAEASFVKAVQVEPNNVSNYSILSGLYILQKNYGAAEENAKAGLKVSPGNPELELILADAYDKDGKREDALSELKKVIQSDPKNVQAYYRMAMLQGSDKVWVKNYLLKVLTLAPANIVPRFQLSELYAANHQTDSARFFLEGVKKIAPDFSANAAESYQKALSLLQAGQPDAALPFIKRFHEIMKITVAYASGKDEIDIAELMAGHSDFTTNLSDRGSNINGDSLYKTIRFTDASASTGLVFNKTIAAAHSVLAVADYDAETNFYVYSSFTSEGSASSQRYLFVTQTGAFKECKGISGLDFAGQDLDAAFADYDNDGYPDLFIATTKGIVVYKNQADGTFRKIEDNIGLNTITAATKLLFADFDQDGDLDIYVAARGGNKFLRNNGDGTFTENAGAMGLTGDPAGTINADFGDWDQDGDMDIFNQKVAGGLQLLNNNRHANFTDLTSQAGLNNPKYAGSVVTCSDYNNDGLPDLFIAGGANNYFLKNTGQGFVVDPVSDKVSKALVGLAVNDAVFFDFDNDGRKDLLVGGASKDKPGSTLRLFHNDGVKGFSDVSDLLPGSTVPVQHLRIVDFNADGDGDIFLSGPGGAQLIRNDGGSNNYFMKVELTGLSYGNSKNNRLGIGAQVELKAGDLYQLKTVTGPVTVFGVGSHNKLDAVRVMWPNGVPQTIIDPARKEKIMEKEQLKGSCPFLFTWNGTKYEFLKDMMWRSALGMPLAVHGADTVHAFSGPSKEYLLIPGEKLQPRNGRYSIKITEELWEAIFFDKVSMVAVDHPASVDIYADERFVAPPYPGRKLYTASDK
jgi:tetratricopeptide (TPR) repeat protein